MLGLVVGEGVVKNQATQEYELEDHSQIHEQKKCLAAKNWIAFCGVDLPLEENSTEEEVACSIGGPN